MKSISVLDCTLRDGGYVNNWNFGYKEKCDITKALIGAGVDIIECGFLSETKKSEKDLSIYSSIDAINETLPSSLSNSRVVCMVNYGEYEIAHLQEYCGFGVAGIRLAFHKKDLKESLEMARKIKEKGYLVFLQPMLTLNYSDSEFVDLIKESNQIEPYAFYIVDSFGTIQRKDMVRFFYIIENNLKSGIKIGFHSHNNLQMAFLNAQALVDIQSQRELIVDSSIHGMGRGAGNLNTELLIHFLNENYEKTYAVRLLLEIEDTVISNIYDEHTWGYSIPNYLSAINLCHPNYAMALDDKKTLTIDDMAEIFQLMHEDKKAEFDMAYLESLYQHYMVSNKKQMDKKINGLIEKIKGKSVLVIAAGKSIISSKSVIDKYLWDENVLCISVNFEYSEDMDYIFVGNRRRFLDIDKVVKAEFIVTSNIETNMECYHVDYQTLKNDNVVVGDNSGLMLLRFLIDSGAQRILVAGMDGYTYDSDANFADEKMKTHTRREYVDMMNQGMSEVIRAYEKEAVIDFLTDTVWQ